MDALRKQVGKARRRMLADHYFRLTCWACFATLILTTLLVLANWYWSWNASPWVLLASGFGAGLIAGGVWTALTRASQIQAAIELDKRFGLKERVSSALALGESDLDSEAGRALTEDAVRRVKNLHVADQFGVKLSRWNAAPLAPALAVVLLAFLLPDIAEIQADPTTQLTPAQRKIMQRQLTDLDKQIREKREAAQKAGLKDAEDLFKKLEEDRQNLAKNEPNDKREALVKLNEMTKNIDDRLQQMEAAEKVKEQLKTIEGMNDGPAEDLAKALQKGDFGDAKEQLQKLAEKIKSGDLSQEQKDKLEAQISKMKDKIDQALAKQQQDMQSLQQQIDQAKKAGDQQRAQQLQQQMDQMQAQQQAQQQMMEKLSDQLGQCAQAMSQGQGEKAAAALGEMAGEMEAMQYNADELGMLAEMSDQLDEMKNQLSQGGMGMGRGQGNGDGLGEGQGEGDRPEQETNTGFHNSQASTNQENANGIVIGEIDGPNRKGIVREAIKNQMNEVQSSDTDPLTNQKLNRAMREHVRQYYDRFRQGGDPTAPPAKSDGN